MPFESLELDSQLDSLSLRKRKLPDGTAMARRRRSGELLEELLRFEDGEHEAQNDDEGRANGHGVLAVQSTNPAAAPLAPLARVAEGLAPERYRDALRLR